MVRRLRHRGDLRRGGAARHKLRALYQRKKGRDLFDLWQALSLLRVDDVSVVAMFGDFLQREGTRITRAQFERNVAQKESMPEFLGDILPLLPHGRARWPDSR